MRVKKTVNCWWFIDSITWRSNALCLPPSAWWLPFDIKAHGYWKKKWCQFGVEVITEKPWHRSWSSLFSKIRIKTTGHLFHWWSILLACAPKKVCRHPHRHFCSSFACTLVHRHMWHVCMNVHVCICSLTSQGRVHSSVFPPTLDEGF